MESAVRNEICDTQALFQHRLPGVPAKTQCISRVQMPCPMMTDISEICVLVRNEPNASTNSARWRPKYPGFQAFKTECNAQLILFASFAQFTEVVRPALGAPAIDADASCYAEGKAFKILPPEREIRLLTKSSTYICEKRA